MYTSNELNPREVVENTTIISPGSNSAVSWPAIFAGATIAAALSLILLILGTGLGLSAVSPWVKEGISATTFGVSSILWITFMSVFASAIGGYVAGRLRAKWNGTHRDEVFFRDTAHGLLTWAIATLATAALLTATVGTIVGGGVKAGAAVVSGVAATAATAGVVSQNDTNESGSYENGNGALNYFVLSLFRKNSEAQSVPNKVAQTPNDPSATAANKVVDKNSKPVIEAAYKPVAVRKEMVKADGKKVNPAAVAEVTTIFVNSLRRDQKLPEADVNYVAQVISQQTNISKQDAKKRVLDTYSRFQADIKEVKAKAKEAADKARAATAYASLWIFISLLMGAFVASLTATFGGKKRDL